MTRSTKLVMQRVLAMIFMCLLAVPLVAQSARQLRVIYLRSYGSEQPVELELTFAGEIIVSEKSFVAGEDWLKDLSWSLKNSSDQPIVCTEVDLDFLGLGRSRDERVYKVRYGRRPDAQDVIDDPRLLLPDESARFKLSDAEYRAIKHFVVQTQTSEGTGVGMSVVDIRIGAVFFEDKTVWKAGELFGPSSQSDTRRSDLDEAERLCLAAQQLEVDAMKSFEATHDRTAEMATHRKAIDNVAKALDIWLRLNEPELIETGSNELARLYLIAQDVDSSVATMGRLAEYWRSQGKRDREGEALFTRSVWLLKAHRFEDALRELQPVIALARENHLPALRAGCLDEKALLLRLLGRTAEAKATAREVRRVRERIEPDAPAAKDAQLPARIPVGWVDVPEAPVAAEIRTVDGEERAVLTNRGTKSMVGVIIGCIVKHGERWQTISELSGVGISDAQVGPGAYFDLTRMFGGPRNRWTNREMGCDNAFPGVVGVRFADGSEWHLPSSSAP